jgi:omega-6 fatty acid desaturase (delta-12 desaturase)
MSADTAAVAPQAPDPNLFRALSQYERPNLRKAVWQLVNTLTPYVALWALMAYLVRQGYSYWFTLALAVVAAALLVRIFIVFHDCGHGSFFVSRRANRIVGYLTGVLTCTPYEDWRHVHAAHHATTGDLDRRGRGDVWTLTVKEYLSAPTLRRLSYRFIRNRFVLLGLVPGCLSLITQRFPHRGAGARERASVFITNVAVLAIVTLAALTIGLGTFVLVQLPIMLIAGTAGVWLFYVQHQYEGVYWARHADWDPIRAALEGSSYYQLPRVLQWATGNIGLHHIHHIRPRIPNYNLQQCYDDLPAMRAVTPLTIRGSLKSLRMNLWDEDAKELVSFRSARKRLRP